MVACLYVPRLSSPVATVDFGTGRYEVTDYQRNRGAELSGFGAPIERLRVLGGVSFLGRNFGITLSHADIREVRRIGRIINVGDDGVDDHGLFGSWGRLGRDSACNQRRGCNETRNP